MSNSSTYQNQWVAVASEVRLADGSVGHIPLIDFHCPIAHENQMLACKVLKRLLPEGSILLESGDSYHGYGCEVRSTEAFLDFLIRSLMFAPIVDRAYVAHQLLERRAALRVSPGGKSNTAPRVVSVDLSGKGGL